MGFAPLLWLSWDSTPVSYVLDVQNPRPCVITVMNRVSIQNPMEDALPDHQPALTSPFSFAASGNCRLTDQEFSSF